ncbi:hypothetical protein [Pseudoxanthomonas wuyuanensis]|uniref:Sulfotransferase family protein n=1 Tax=Pseudoxanthomonas wuyuanensis TaxID=1073196 RepID=A0A286D6Z2_9GAMM|nr:hypothetical protein [Pseudoxanthomonas wuyuanensis]KAF1719075.1 hypothetical protein CSC75_16645 [Pseudoxanthomonas wuyuanensis]SOD54384.1 hypothetical protein SAMN06296416_103309 [Pseudoxanthomonas wuyuanensis]
MSDLEEKTPKRDAILVLGMHRSGTSALGGALARLGVTSPRTKLPPASDNPKGFWESAELLKFNDQILSASGSRWNDWGKLNEDWHRSLLADEFVERLRPVFHHEFGDAPLVFIKDPRICRFAPFWLRALDALGYRSKVLIPLRSPLEVADSLAARNGFGRTYSLLLWLRHVLEAEASTRNIPRAFVHYTHLLQDCKEEMKRISERLAIVWPRWSLTALSELETYLTNDLRHQHGNLELSSESPLGRWVSLTVGALDKLSHAESDEARAVLDQVRFEFDTGADIFGVAARENERRLDGGIGARDQKIAALMSDLEAAQRSAEQHRATSNSKDARIAELQAAMEERAMELERAIGEKEASIGELKAELTRASNDIEQLTKALQEAKRTQQSEAELKRFKAQAEIRLSQGKTIVQELSKANKDLSLQNGQLQRSIKERYEEIARLTKLVIRQEREFDLRFQERDALAISQFQQKSEEVRQLRDELTSIRRGLVWRTAAPVRKVSRLLGGRNEAAGNLQRLVATISASDLFDRDWYRQTYADVDESGMDPVLHYLQFGAAEGRDPGPRFNVRSYLRKNMDVARSGMNPLLHYLEHGRFENRSPT